MKKALVECGIFIALGMPVSFGCNSIGGVALDITMLYLVICSPALMILSKVIMRIMGWDK